MPGRLRESAAPRRKAVAGQVLSDSVLLRQRHNFVSEAHWRIALPVRLFAGTVIEESFLLIRLREISMVLNRAFSVAIVACASFFTLNAMAGELRSEMEAENARWLKAFNTPNPDAFPPVYTKDALLFPDDQPPVTEGPEARKQLRAKTREAGFKDHTLKINTTRHEGNVA